MRVHHLSCATLRPLGGRRVNGDRPPFRAARMVCHCLLIETDRGLVLVDSGFGLSDIARLRNPGAALRSRSGSADSLPRQLARNAYSTVVTRPRLDPADTAIRQVERLGHSPDDVSDIVLTHLDLDHAGGLPDFPAARVHLSRAEHDFAMSAATSAVRSVHRFRYWPYQWAHGPQWVTYDAAGGEPWFGFEGVRELDGMPGIALVPLPGHSPGHCGVAVRGAGSGGGAGARWLLHAADAYFDHREIDPVAPRSTPGVAAFQARFQFDASARRASRQRLRELVAAHGDQVELFCSHDPVEFDRYRRASA
jgi:glyoxylase-like metal-dependent hydrolase (beta-lactamase superfamily II)